LLRRASRRGRTLRRRVLRVAGRATPISVRPPRLLSFPRGERISRGAAPRSSSNGIEDIATRTDLPDRADPVPADDHGRARGGGSSYHRSSAPHQVVCAPTTMKRTHPSGCSKTAVPGYFTCTKHRARLSTSAPPSSRSTRRTLKPQALRERQAKNDDGMAHRSLLPASGPRHPPHRSAARWASSHAPDRSTAYTAPPVRLDVLVDPKDLEYRHERLHVHVQRDSELVDPDPAVRDLRDNTVAKSDLVDGSLQRGVPWSRHTGADVLGDLGRHPGTVCSARVLTAHAGPPAVPPRGQAARYSSKMDKGLPGRTLSMWRRPRERSPCVPTPDWVE
jgi:hypothetical protein